MRPGIKRPNRFFNVLWIKTFILLIFNTILMIGIKSAYNVFKLIFNDCPLVITFFFQMWTLEYKINKNQIALKIKRWNQTKLWIFCHCFAIMRKNVTKKLTLAYGKCFISCFLFICIFCNKFDWYRWGWWSHLVTTDHCY